MDWLKRELSPLSKNVWKAVDETAAGMAKQTLVARRVADVEGPRGWDSLAIPLGTYRPLSAKKSEGPARLSVPQVMLMTEIRTEFVLSWASIDIFERGGSTLDNDSIEEAARQTALAEDRHLFYGESEMPGLLSSSKSPRIALSDWSIPGRAVTDLLTAVEKLDELGVKGPYEAVLSPANYYSYLRTSVGGGSYPAAKQLGLAIQKVHSSPVIKRAVLLSTRGGDFRIIIGGDFSVGYRWHDQNNVHLFCVETIAAQLITPEALCMIWPD